MVLRDLEKQARPSIKGSCVSSQNIDTRLTKPRRFLSAKPSSEGGSVWKAYLMRITFWAQEGQSKKRQEAGKAHMC